MTKVTAPTSRKDQTLHIMFFVDSGATRTVSVSVRTLKLAAAGVLGFAVSFVLFATTTFAFGVQISALEKNARELKRAFVAQSIVEENLLKVAPFMVKSGDNVTLNPAVAGVTGALAKGSPLTPGLEEAGLADAEPTDEDPLTTKAPEKRSAPKGSKGLAAAALPVTETAPAPLAVPAPATAQARAEAQLSTPAAVATAAASPSDATPSAPQASASQVHSPAPEREAGKSASKVVIEGFRARYDDHTQRLLVNFNLRKKLASSSVIEGGFCAFVTGTNPQGETVTLAFPPGTKADDAQKDRCTRPYPVRFARLRPSALTFDTEPLQLQSATVLFVSEGQKMRVSSPLP